MARANLSKTLLLSVTLSAAISIALLGGFFMVRAYLDFESISIDMREAYVEDQKSLIKEQVNNAIAYIEYKKTQVQSRSREYIKNRVYEAHSIASHLYNKHRYSMPLAELKNLIRETLRPVRFNQGKGYYFATNLNGVEELFSDKPELEGKNLLGITGGNGKYVVRDMIEIVKENGEGFYSYNWTKPGETGNQYAKLAFVKLFKPFNWLIGTGEYIEDVEKEIQAEIIDRIEQIRFKGNNYIFISQWDGFSLTQPGKGKNNFNATDVNGLKVVQELIALAKDGQGYLRYVVPAFTGLKPASKISYVRGVPDWQWYVGAGEYLDDIEAVIQERREEFKQQIILELLLISGLIVFLILLSYLAAQKTTKKARQDLVRFQDFYASIENPDKHLEVDKLHFDEFKTLAAATNQMADELRWAQQRVMTVLDNLNADVYVTDLKKHEILYTNQHVRNTFGDGLEGELCHRAFRNTPHGPCEQCQKPFLLDENSNPKGPVVWEAENPVTGRWLRNQDQAIRWMDGELVHLQISTDITENKNAEREKAKLEASLHQAQKMEAIGTLAGGIAHDFNNILAAITGYSELALEDAREGQTSPEEIAQILNAAGRAKELVSKILTFSRKMSYQLKPLDLNQVIGAAASIIERTIPKMISLELQLSNELKSIKGDPTQLEQVLLNLAVNAKDAMPNGGRLVIGAENITLDADLARLQLDADPGDYVLLTISDTGVGMDRKTLEHIFEPFYTTKEIGKGTGLGLASVYGIVKSHKGYTTCYSEPGKGTTFKIYLPAAGEGPRNDKSGKTYTPLIDGGTETILLVDDEEVLREIGSRILTSMGYQVMMAESGEEALATFNEEGQAIDLVIMDISMPGMGGYLCLKELRKLNPDLKVIIASGYWRPGQSQGQDAPRASGYITKPFRKEDLLRSVRQVLDQ